MRVKWGQKLRFRIELYVKLYEDEGQKFSSGKVYQLEGQNTMSRMYVSLWNLLHCQQGILLNQSLSRFLNHEH